MKPFREMNPMLIGTLGLALMAGGLAVSFQTDKLPFVGYRDIYRADFTEAAGLQPADEVRVAGIKVGKVTDISLEGDRVRVTMRLRDVEVGDQSRADIKIKTVLGRKYVALTPAGTGNIDSDEVIPTSRTTSPFDVAPAFQGLAETVDDINTTQLAQAFTTLASTFRDTPDEVRSSLEGLSRLSTTIASRDAQLKQLLARSRGVTDTLARRDQDLVSFLADTNLILDEVHKRREVINQLLTSTTDLADQLTSLVRENRATLKPALDRLRGVVTVLKQNQANLDASIQRLAPFVRVFANNLGNGRWFDVLIYNLTDLPTFTPRADGLYPCGALNKNAPDSDHDGHPGGTPALANCFVAANK